MKAGSADGDALTHDGSYIPLGDTVGRFPWASGWRATVLLVLGVTALRLAYLAWGCPYTLIEDEAHYWEWSRRPGWSYYSKGPGIAWAVAASTAVFGDTEFGVRLPGALFGAAGALAIAWLARTVTGDGRAGFFSALCALLTPAFQLGGILLTVDMPYCACWALACGAGWKALQGGSRGAWGALGLSIGIGFLFKYTILLLVPGLVLFAMWSPSRVARRTAGIVLACGVFGVCTIPVVIWNSEHGWPTVGHLLGHVGLPGGDMPPPESGPGPSPRPVAWLLGYVGSQIALIGPVLVLMVLGAGAALRSDVRTRQGAIFLIVAGSPILVVYALLALRTRVEGNWAIAGYVPLLALAGWGVAARHLGAVRSAWRVSLVFGLVLGFGALRLDLIDRIPAMRSLESGLARAGAIDSGTRLIPKGRLCGARAMANDVAALGSHLRGRTGLEPFFVGEHYGRASLLAFYLPGQPLVYCSSSQRDEGRRTQYDYWPDTDLGNLAVLGGRPAVLVGSKASRWAVAFDAVEPVGVLPNETKRDRRTFLGLGYRGFVGGADARELQEEAREREGGIGR